MADNGSTTQDQGDSVFDRAYPPALREAERQRIRQRRGNAGVDGGEGCIGLAISGGGIRSATFSLGVLQVLARQDLLKKIDFLSTVSGGGYIGGFLGRLYSRPAGERGPVADCLKLDGAPAGPIRPVQWLKENGEYMAPGGGSDLLALASSALRNLVAFHLVIGTALLLGLLLFDLLAKAHVASWLPSFGAWLQEHVSCSLVPSAALDLLPLALAAAVPPGWAYWLIERRRKSSMEPMTGFAIVLAGAAAMLAAACFFPEPATKAQAMTAGCSSIASVASAGGTASAALLVPSALLAFGVLSWLVWAEAMARSRRHAAAGDWSADNADAAALFVLADARARVTRWLTVTLMALGGLAVFALVDTLGATLYAVASGGLWSAALTTLILPLLAKPVGARRFLDPLLGDTLDKWKPSLFAILALLGLVAGFALLVGLSVLAHGIVHGFTGDADTNWTAIRVALVLLFLCTLTFGRTWVFVNRSSYAQIYSARLARAFLGASNPKRFAGGRLASVTEPIEGDDTSLPEYHRGLLDAGGPLHLINVTINQTTGSDDSTVVRDRKGTGMAVGPCGLSAGVRHHALLEAAPGDGRVHWHAELRPVDRGHDFAMFGPAPEGQNGLIEVERLTLGQWIGISGAAFSTALGSRTSLGRSLFMALANVRLGYWWDAGLRQPDARRALNWLRRWLPVHMHLFDEITARFHGPHARYWYLTDGGHFENMGGYELIRRRLPMMVVIDAEEDPDYIYEGFANLVRKARLDFGAEIAVLDAGQLDDRVHPGVRALFGTLEELKLPADGYSKKRAALAEVRYGDGSGDRSLLLYLKPTLRPSDPTDLHHYRHENPSFPQQPTFDQFFDEAQWESYRRLGETIAAQVFRTVDERSGMFAPCALKPVPPA